MLQVRHAPAIQQSVSDPAIAEMTRIPHPYPEHGAAEFVKQAIAEREVGTAFSFAIEDRGQLVGVCGLREVNQTPLAELGFWVGRPYWGKGYATFGVTMTLEFAFRNLQLPGVRANAYETNSASRRVLEKTGFQFIRLAQHHEPGLKRPDELFAEYEIQSADWCQFLSAPHLTNLQPDLTAILAAEIAAGNEVVETGSGWPDADSVFVRLKHPFRVQYTSLPQGITHTTIADPHWWKAEYCSQSPRHILAY